MEAADLDAWATCYWCAMNEQEAEDEEDKGKAKAAKDPAKASGTPSGEAPLQAPADSVSPVLPVNLAVGGLNPRRYVQPCPCADCLAGIPPRDPVTNNLPISMEDAYVMALHEAARDLDVADAKPNQRPDVDILSGVTGATASLRRRKRRGARRTWSRRTESPGQALSRGDLHHERRSRRRTESRAVGWPRVP